MTNKTGASASIIKFITMKSVGIITTPISEGPFSFECKISQLKISNDGYIIDSSNIVKQQVIKKLEQRISITGANKSLKKP